MRVEDNMQVKRVQTPQELERCLTIRRRVFIEEQHVPEDLELDGHDDECVHFLAVDDRGDAVGTARLKTVGENAKAQRVAVMKSARGTGVGRVVMQALETEARARKLNAVVLSSQVSAIPFYERLGYSAHGPVYDDAGIPHRDMLKKL